MILRMKNKKIIKQKVKTAILLLNICPNNQADRFEYDDD